MPQVDIIDRTWGVVQFDQHGASDAFDDPAGHLLNLTAAVSRSAFPETWSRKLRDTLQRTVVLGGVLPEARSAFSCRRARRAAFCRSFASRLS